MPRRVHIQQGEEHFDLVEQSLHNELVLQEVLKSHPQLIPADDLGFDRDLLVVGRETASPRGHRSAVPRVDGDLVLVETKTGRKNPDFRHALAQLIDYGSDLWKMSVEDFDRGVVQAYLASRYVEPRYRRVTSLEALVAEAWQLDASAMEALSSRLAEVLSTGDFTFVVAAQHFTPSMVSSVAFLNENARRARYFLLEVIQFARGDMVAHAAQVAAALVAHSPGAAAALLAGEDAFLEGLDHGPYREAAQAFLAQCRTLGLRFAWGSRARRSAYQFPTPRSRCRSPGSSALSRPGTG